MELAVTFGGRGSRHSRSVALTWKMMAFVLLFNTNV